MGKFLKQPQPRTTGPRKAKKQPTTPETNYEPTEVGGIECALSDLARHVRSFVHNAATGENKLAVFTGPEGSGYHPILIALEPSDTMDRFIEATERMATAFERIADALSRTPAPVQTEAAVNDAEQASN